MYHSIYTHLKLYPGDALDTGLSNRLAEYFGRQLLGG